MSQLSSDPDRTYAHWLWHLARCRRCAAAGELQPEQLCSQGRKRLLAWLLPSSPARAA